MAKKTDQSKSGQAVEMRREYDFTGGVRGKHTKAYRQGHTVTVHKKDGTTLVQHFKLEDGAVILDQDVREYFPTSEDVNHALRALIALIPEKSQRSKPQRTQPVRQ
jgi:hypothetical protein